MKTYGETKSQAKSKTLISSERSAVFFVHQNHVLSCSFLHAVRQPTLPELFTCPQVTLHAHERTPSGSENRRDRCWNNKQEQNICAKTKSKRRKEHWFIISPSATTDTGTSTAKHLVVHPGFREGMISHFWLSGMRAEPRLSELPVMTTGCASLSRGKKT